MIDTIQRRRLEEALILRNSGLTFKAIGEKFGVSKSRVAQMLWQLDNIKRREKIDAEIKADPNSGPWWYGLDRSTIHELIRSGKNSREDCIQFTSDNLVMWRGSVALPGWEEDRDVWSTSNKKFKLKTVNKIRQWLGYDDFYPVKRITSEAELNRARRLLETHGYKIEQPNAAHKRQAKEERSDD
jgi:hypothetical protein